jgi:hypothetical protein
MESQPSTLKKDAPSKKASVLVDLPPTLCMISKGIWLPTGRSTFFNPDKDRVANSTQMDRDRTILAGYNCNDIPRPDELKGFQFKDDAHRCLKRLQSSVFYRLYTVLANDFFLPRSNWTGKRYTQMFPLFDKPHLVEENMPDPLGILFTGDDYESPEWAATKDYMEGIVLAVHYNGFYVWSVLYQHGSTEEEDLQRKKAIDSALDKHMEFLIGDGFFSHYPERNEDAPDGTNPGSVQAVSIESPTRQSAINVASYESSPSIKTYRDQGIGFLNYFQLNILLEGIYNYNFDPRIFFDDGTGSKVQDAKKEYSLDNFMYLARTKVDVVSLDPNTPPSESPLAIFYTLIKSPELLRNRDTLAVFHRLHRDVFQPKVRFELLNQFLRKTSATILHIMKLRIESCSRSLLQYMIEIAHLRQTFLQADVPDLVREDGTNIDQERYLIKKANEGQLRGYVMLLAAKIPLFSNVADLLEDNLNALKGLELKYAKDFPTVGVPHFRKELRAFENTWLSLLKSIEGSVQGLEIAIDQAYKNQMLEETEKLRSEEENIAEIERIRSRTGGSLGPTGSIGVNIAANILAFVGLFYTISLGLTQVKLNIPLVQNIEAQGPLLTSLMIIGIVFLLAGVYAIAQAIIDAVLRAASRLFGILRRSREERYFYEMDIALNAAIRTESATKLIEGKLPPTPFKNSKIFKDLPETMIPFIDQAFRKPERSSFRVSRSSLDQSLFKIYFDAHLIWPRRGMRGGLRYLFRKQSMRVFIVYEILFHKPSGIEEYKIKSVRMVTNTGVPLHSARIAHLRAFVVYQFVNPWLDSERDRLTNADAALSLNAGYLVKMGESTQKKTEPASR